MKQGLCSLLFLLFASCSLHAAGPETLVGAYYYPWYDDNSFHGGNPTGSTTLGFHLEPTQVQPALGWYDQDNASVISQHYDWARYSGVDFFVCSYWGMGTGEDSVIRNRMFNNPDRGDIKLCVFLEPRLTPAGGATETKMRNETNYLCDNYFDHPSYLYIDGKPVIFIYVTRAMSDADLTLCLDTIRSAAADKGKEVYIAGDEVWGSPSTSVDGPRVSQMDAVTNYDVYGNNGASNYVTDSRLNTWQSRNAQWKSLADSYGTTFIPAIAPGFNDRAVRLASGHAACSRKLNNESNEFGTLFSGMIDRLETNVDIMMITSWNEWHEDTQIEPTTVAAPTNVDDSAAGNDYTQDVYHEGYGMRYLDILREHFFTEAVPFGVSANGENPPNETAEKAFDGNVNTKWLDFSPEYSWIQYRYADYEAVYVNKYALTSGNDVPQRDPMDFNLLGSNDGLVWYLLDSRSGVTFADRKERIVIPISSPGVYNIYRLEITSVSDPATATAVQLSEVELLTCVGSADLECDGIVDIDDLSYMAGAWLGGDITADINMAVGNIVNLLDMSMLSSQWLADNGTVEVVWDPQSNGIVPPATGDWSDSGNWTTAASGRPEGNFRCVFNIADAAEAVVVGASHCYQLMQGYNGDADAGTIRVADGGVLTTDANWSVIGYNRQAKMVVLAGGVVKFGGHLLVGQDAGSIGTLHVKGGTVDVAGDFSLGWNGGTGYANLVSGVLNLSQWAGIDAIKGDSLMDITGGAVVIDGDQTAVVNDLVTDGKIVSYAGAGTVNVSYADGKTTVTATSP